MKIGKAFERSAMIYVEIDLTGKTQLTGNYFMIPAKNSILRRAFNEYYVQHEPDGKGCVRLYPYETYYVEWNGKIYHVDSPAKYDVLVNIISTDFALAQLE